MAGAIKYADIDDTTAPAPLGVGIVFDLDDEEQSTAGAYKFTCKNCKKEGRAKTDRKKYCNNDCRYEYNALVKLEK